MGWKSRPFGDSLSSSKKEHVLVGKTGEKGEACHVRRLKHGSSKDQVFLEGPQTSCAKVIWPQFISL